ncbi:MAG: TlpA family protein disulfide reductase, partial [Paramuribaculum sp.]|nr:TlpA family protein disulfide reductase [Paramuribaculum sp.]
MKTTIFAAATGLLLMSCSGDKGSVTIHLPSDYQEKNIVVNHVMLDNMFSARQADDVIMIYDTLEVKNGIATMKLDPAGAARYNIEPPKLTRSQPEFYAIPDESLDIDIRSFEPLDYSMTGSELMEDYTAFRSATQPIRQEYVDLVSSNDYPDMDQIKAIMDRYEAAVKKFVADRPESPMVPFAITELAGDDFKTIFDNMNPQAKKSILMPFAEAYNEQVEQARSEFAQEEARKAEVASGTIEAPGFTLPDMAGKNVSLSDFRGKWVVLDFWGSWCGWCVKGFPALKEAYSKYGDKIVVIGIDCNETDDAWRAGVKNHDLPWINVYNGLDRAIYDAYGITAFPTKAIINPEGK